MATITGEEAREYARRWQQVARQEASELRQADMQLKLRQLSSLMASRDIVPADPLREHEVQLTRERWQRLRRALAGG